MPASYLVYRVAKFCDGKKQRRVCVPARFVLKFFRSYVDYELEVNSGVFVREGLTRSRNKLVWKGLHVTN